MAKQPFRFSSKTLRSVNTVKLRDEILQSYVSSPEFKSEISKIFQRANRRIQNVEQSGLFSPAVENVVSKRGDGFTKFSMRGNWQQLKEDYIEAVAFLNQPTSTLTGTKDYAEQIKTRYELSDDEYSILTNEYRGKLSTLHGSQYVEQYLMQYKDFSGTFYETLTSVGNQIETDARESENELDLRINDILSNFDETILGIEQLF